MPDHNNLFSKSTLFYKTKKVISKRRKCFKTRSMLDFSTEHKFKLGGEALDDFCIKIQIKGSTPLLKKSMHIFVHWNCFIFAFPDPVLAELTLGPSEEGRKGLQWKEMMDQPEERIYFWHSLDFKIWNYSLNKVIVIPNHWNKGFPH